MIARFWHEPAVRIQMILNLLEASIGGQLIKKALDLLHGCHNSRISYSTIETQDLLVLRS